MEGQKTQRRLGLGKSEFRERCIAIEKIDLAKAIANIADPERRGEITKGRLHRLKRFLLDIFKNPKSGPDGIFLCVRTPGHTPTALSLVDMFHVSKNTADNWIRWAKAIGVIDTAIDTDDFGRKRTTIQIIWQVVHDLREPEPPRFQNAAAPPVDDQFGWVIDISGGKLVDNQSTMDADQCPTVGDQSPLGSDHRPTVGSQCTTVGLSLLPITNIQPPPAPCPGLVAENSVNGAAAFGGEQADDVREEPLNTATVDEVTDQFRRAGTGRTFQLAVEFASRPLAEITDAVDTFLANRNLFEHPGALVAFLRDGVWPVEGVVDISLSRRIRRDRVREADAAAWAGRLWKRIRELRRDYFTKHGQAVDDDQCFVDQLKAEGFPDDVVQSELFHKDC